MKHLRSILLLPGMVLVVIPVLLTYLIGSLHIGWSLHPPFSMLPIAVGSLLIILGLFLMIHSMRLFSRIGQGTLAPWDPTHKLVVKGAYRFVRNPMITGVLCVLLGEAMLLGSFPIFLWFLFFMAANAVYLPFSEEPVLEGRFGKEFMVYKENVPRWIPRRTPWEDPTNQDMGR